MRQGVTPVVAVPQAANESSNSSEKESSANDCQLDSKVEDATSREQVAETTGEVFEASKSTESEQLADPAVSLNKVDEMLPRLPSDDCDITKPSIEPMVLFHTTLLQICIILFLRFFIFFCI